MTLRGERSAEWRELFEGRRGSLLAGLLLTEFAAAVQVFVFATVLPLASGELHGARLYGAVLAAGTLANVAALAFAAALVRRLSPARVLSIATAFYAIGLLLAAVSPSMIMLLLAEILQGVGAGLFAGFSLSAAAATFPEQLRPRVIALTSSMWIAPALVGPPVAALISSVAGWRWAVVAVLPVVITARLMVVRQISLLPELRSSQRTTPLMAALLVGALGLAIFGSGRGGALGVALAVAGMAAVLASLTRLALGVSSSRPGAFAGLASVLLLAVGFFGADGMVSLALVTGLGHTVAVGGLVLTAGALSWALSSLFLQGWITRHGRLAARTGPALIVLGAATLAVALLTGDRSAGPVVACTTGWVLGGLGMGMAYPVLTVQPLARLSAEELSAAANLVVLGEVVGASLGGLIGGLLYSAAGLPGLSASGRIGIAFAVFAFIALLLLGVQTVGTASEDRSSGARSDENALRWSPYGATVRPP